MKRFAYIQNNEVQYVDYLPTNFKNISNFSSLDYNNPTEFEIIKNSGWLPVETISDNLPILVSISYVIEDDLVKEIITGRNKTEEEILQEQQDLLAAKWNNIRHTRNSLLQKSDLSVVSDKWEQMDLPEKSAWSNYRQQLRDLPQTFNNPEDVVWPVEP